MRQDPPWPQDPRWPDDPGSGRGQPDPRQQRPAPPPGGAGEGAQWQGYPPPDPYQRGGYPPQNPQQGGYPPPDPYQRGGYPPQNPNYGGNQGYYPPTEPFNPPVVPPSQGWAAPQRPIARPRPQRWPEPGQPSARYAPAQRVVVTHERARRRHAFGWSLPIEHIVLAAGLVMLALALTQPWGVDARGNEITLTPTTTTIATYAIGASVVLGALLVLLNKRMGCMALIGCLGLFLVPLIVAAGIGGFVAFTNLPAMPHHLSPQNIQATNRGFYLWWGGLAVVLAGLFLQVITHKRKGLLGI